MSSSHDVQTFRCWKLVLTQCRQVDRMRPSGWVCRKRRNWVRRLRAAGLQLPDDLFTQEELHDHLLRLWKEKQGKGGGEMNLNITMGQYTR